MHDETGSGLRRCVMGTVFLAIALLASQLVAAQTLDSSDSHSCRIIDGGVQCWGSNIFGQLGDGTKLDSAIALNVIGMGPNSGATAVATGFGFTCAVQNGGLKCWGHGALGGLGTGSYSSELEPADVVGMTTGVSAVALGNFHACAIQTGALKCWGLGLSGRLGVGSVQDSNTPLEVDGMSSGVLAVAAGHDHTCAIRKPPLSATSSLKCWGANLSGQLGIGQANESEANWLPQLVQGMSSNVTAVDAGGRHSCAVQSGALKCWGQGSSGQLGNGVSADSLLPVGVTGLSSNVSTVSAGAFHSCATKSTGEAYCWGRNESGQVGNGSLVDQPTPAPIGNTIQTVSAGSIHSCFQNHSDVWCWGSLGPGLLGVGESGYALQPTIVPLDAIPESLTAGRDHSCAVVFTGSFDREFRCWGRDDSQQLGDGAVNSSGSIVTVGGGAPLTTGGAAGIAGGRANGCAFAGGATSCWGEEDWGELGNGGGLIETVDAPVPVSGLGSGTVALSARYGTVCAIQEVQIPPFSTIAGLKCWGNNLVGQLGDGTTVDRATPVVPVGMSTGLHAVATGGNHTCAIQSAAVKCWGSNASGQLGDGTTTTAHQPVAVTGLSTGVEGIAVGSSHSCALVDVSIPPFGAEKQLRCWGANQYAQLGAPGPATTTPAIVNGIPGEPAFVWAAANSSCAANAAGELWCWGQNADGQLGIGSRESPAGPTHVALPGPVLSVSMGDAHACAVVDQSGVGASVWCWGKRTWGKLGDGELGFRTLPGNEVVAAAIFADSFE